MDWIDHAPYIVCCNHLGKPSLIVQNGYLGGKTIGQVRLRTARLVDVFAELAGVVANPFSVENFTY